MILRTLGTITIVALMASVASASDKKSAERVRQETVDFIQKMQIDSGVKERFTRLVENDSEPLALSDAEKLLQATTPSKQDEVVAKCYLVVVPFRYRDDPKEVLAFFNAIPYGYQVQMLFLYQTLFFDLVTPELDVIGENVLREELSRLQDEPSSTNIVQRRIVLCRTAIAFSIRANVDDAIKPIQALIMRHVSDASVRFNLVAEAISDGKAKAVDLGLWYFDNYCCTKFETGALVNYLKLYMDDEPFQAAIAKKKAELTAACDQLQ